MRNNYVLVATVGVVGVVALVLASFGQARRSQEQLRPAPLKPLLQEGKLSQRVVSYEIDAQLDPSSQTITATQVLRYRNLTGRAQRVFPFHLYMNAFQTGSTYARRFKGDRSGREFKEPGNGSIEIASLAADGYGDLTEAMQFIQPDDDNVDDRTVMEVRLPRAVPPGRTVTFRFEFQSKLPEFIIRTRTGYKRDFFFVGQWFPKVGVWWKGEWNCHQFHSSTEFFADFGTYDVNLTLPSDYVVGASGVQTSDADNGDGTKTLTFRAEDVHDFAWTASPHFRVVEQDWTGSLGPVRMRALIAPGHIGQAARYLQALSGTLELYDRWVGPYPYSQVTLVDPPHGGGGAGGMEYPTLFTGGTTWWLPEGIRAPEIVTEHEFGHQYWYGMVASNEFEDAWLDEGINQYVEGKIIDELYGADTSMMNLFGATLGDGASARLGYISRADTDPMVRNGWEFMTGGSYGAVTYSKTATVLQTLEGMLGEDTMREAIRTYFLRYRFTHPTEEDFLRTVEQVAGQNLRWFFDQAVYGTRVLDYAVRQIRSTPVRQSEESAPDEPALETAPPSETGAESDESEETVAGDVTEDAAEDVTSEAAEEAAEEEATIYDTEVLIHRKGDFILPVEIEVRFDDGEVIRENWDGRDRWVRFTYRRAARAVSASVDPDGKVALDINRLNNSRSVRPDARATKKLSTYWMLYTQFFSQALAWFV